MFLKEKYYGNENDGFSSLKSTTKKIMIVGDSGVGKTSLGERFAYSKTWRNYPMTIGVNFMTKRIPVDNNKSVILLIIDAAGQSRFEKIREAFYHDVELFIAVCDLTRKKSL